MLEAHKTEFGKIRIDLYSCISYQANPHPKKNTPYSEVYVVNF